MKQLIKSFNHQYVTGLEQEINQWLKENPAYVIDCLTMTTGLIPDGNKRAENDYAFADALVVYHVKNVRSKKGEPK